VKVVGLLPRFYGPQCIIPRWRFQHRKTAQLYESTLEQMQGLGWPEFDRVRCEQPIPAERVRSEVQTVQFYDDFTKTPTPLEIADMFLHHHLRTDKIRTTDENVTELEPTRSLLLVESEQNVGKRTRKSNVTEK